MENTKFDQCIKKLSSIATYLDEKNMKKLADQIDKISRNLLNIKTAQYVGVQGYWIRNTRCWSNCYRQKRAETELSSQEIWQECHKEYLESISDPESGWEKYAEENGFVKTADNKTKKIITSEIKQFHKELEIKTAKGVTPEIAVETIIKKNLDKYSNAIIDQTLKLTKIAEILHNNKKIKLANSLVKIAEDMVKEAGFWQGVKDFFTSSEGMLKALQNKIILISHNMNKYYEKFYNNPEELAKRFSAITVQPMVREMIPIVQKISDPVVKNQAQEFVQNFQETVNNVMSNPTPEFIRQSIQNLNNLAMGVNQLIFQIPQQQQKQQQGQQQGQQGPPPLPPVGQKQAPQFQSVPASEQGDNAQQGGQQIDFIEVQNMIQQLDKFFGGNTKPQLKKEMLTLLDQLVQRKKEAIK